jgi:hypothetical protein
MRSRIVVMLCVTLSLVLIGFIIQDGVYKSLRDLSARRINTLDQIR